MKVSVISPKEIVWEGDAVSVRAPGVLGNFGVLKNHAPLLSELTVGELIIKSSDSSEPVNYRITGGYLEVRDNNIIALAGVNNKKLSP